MPTLQPVSEKDLMLNTSFETYSPDDQEQKDIQEALSAYVTSRNVMQRNYEYFNGRNLFECIDDWTKRWNGYIPPLNPLIDQTSWNIFYNFTRNAIISYLAHVALKPPEAKIIAINKKSKLPSKKFAEALTDLNQYSLNEENGDARFMEAALEAAVKGTAVVYEGYMKNFQTEKVPTVWDAETGKITYKEKDKIIFDNCYQTVVPLEDFYITNAFQADVQKQPKIIWRRLTTYFEAQNEFSHYKNWKYVRPGNYTLAMEMQTFYRQAQLTDLPMDRVEILRYYCRRTNSHIVLCNGVVMYSGPIPFKDGKYPFAKTVNEPFGNDFFWGQGMPGKYMGEQDLINSFINMMAQKTTNSLLPTGLSSDLDDLIEDDVIEIGKIRQVSDVNKWTWWEAPAVNSGEFNMFQTVLGLAKDTANVMPATPGNVTARQILLQQQQLTDKIAYNINFLEDLEVDRTKLRTSHILQFYAIPRIERITGKGGKEMKDLVYRDIHVSNTTLSDGRKGTKLIKIIGGEHKNPDTKQKLADNLSAMEVAGEEQGIPTEALAISADIFQDFDVNVQVVRDSSLKRNQALDQASRLELANWRFSIAQAAPLANPEGLVEWVEESFDVDKSQFEEAPTGQMGQNPQQQQLQQGALPQQSGGQPQGAGGPSPIQQMQPSTMNQGMGGLLAQPLR
jgi:hypothetical protein